MKKIAILGLFLVGLCVLPAFAADSPQAAGLKADLARQIDAASNASDKVKAFAKEKILPLSTNPVFIAEIKSQNSKGVTLDQIKADDQEWTNALDQTPLQKEKLTNKCADEVRTFVTANPAVSEVFVMDNQGANVGQNLMTSDYWQGDEPKWQKSFNGGKGGIDISDAKLDKSSNVIDQKISVPIFDDSGAVIGAICVGLRVDKL